MEWATDLHLVSLLQKYLSPPPIVTDLVRGQLMTPNQDNDITMALNWVPIGTGNPYEAILDHTCIWWGDQGTPNAVPSDLPTGLFDLMLGDRIRTLLLENYTDTHIIRGCIRHFVNLYDHKTVPRSTPEGLWSDGAMQRVSHPPEDWKFWWDGFGEGAIRHERWVSKRLGEDTDLEVLLRAWDHDNETLQNWLGEHEKAVALANSWDQERDWVFSEEEAIKVISFVKVRPPS